jgi:gluconokinase
MSMAESQHRFRKVRLFVVMGVSGCGKSTVATALALASGGTAIDGDDFHPAENIGKMSAGLPLTDDDRWPWLDIVGQKMRSENGLVFCACSALKRKYRQRIAAAAQENVMFLHLHGSKSLIAGRMRKRQGHFMPNSLLESQFAALEIPGPDEMAVTIDISASESEIVESLLNEIGAMT